MLRLHNTLSRKAEEVRPLEGNLVRIYSCGPTVYRPQHIGNVRSYLLSDLIARTVEYHGCEVRRLMNITDVGHMTDELSDAGRDKMLLAMEDENLTTSEIAQKYTEHFLRDTDAVNIRRADLYPKATDHIAEIIELVAKLIERGHAYEVDGSVFYDVTTFPAYGALSHQALDDMRAAHRIEGVHPDKRNHQDFVLWVAAGARRDLVFESPWGTGYPGWHIECSAMSLSHFGDRFEIHTGGVDNRFPHHEDEIAQSEGAVGHKVVELWAHGEHLLMDSAKMAKSAGNVVTIQTIVEQDIDPLAFRYLCFTGRYRRQVDFTDQALEGAATTLRRLRERVAMLGVEGDAPATDAALRADARDAAITYHDRFMSAIDDDLDFPAAIVVVHDALSDEGIAPADRWMLVASWDNILGLGLAGSGELTPELHALVRERDEARAAKDFARADEIRERLQGSGVDVLDSAAGTRWVKRTR